MRQGRPRPPVPGRAPSFHDGRKWPPGSFHAQLESQRGRARSRPRSQGLPTGAVSLAASSRRRRGRRRRQRAAVPKPRANRIAAPRPQAAGNGFPIMAQAKPTKTATRTPTGAKIVSVALPAMWRRCPGASGSAMRKGAKARSRQSLATALPVSAPSTARVSGRPRVHSSWSSRNFGPAAWRASTISAIA